MPLALPQTGLLTLNLKKLFNMKARIVKNIFCGLYTDEFLLNNNDKKVNGALVSEWNLTDKIPSEDIQKPFWNGIDWEESITDEGLEAKKSEKIKELNQLQFQELAETDWYYIRKAETGENVPIDVEESRAAIRQKYDDLKLLL